MITQGQYQQDREAWRQRWYQKGFFGPETAAQVLAQGVLDHPGTEFNFYRTAESADCVAHKGATLEEIWQESLHVANGLWAEGVRPGQVIAIQMPTWYETLLLYLAAFNIGAIVLPIVHIYGPREVEFILRQSGAATLVIPDRWHKIDFVDRFRHVAPLSGLARVIVVGEETPPDMVDWRRIRNNDAPPFPTYEGDPDGPCALLYTSGTTSAPKGVLYSHNNLQSEWRGPFFATKGPYLCNFPAGHIAGFNFVLRPIVTGMSMVYFDQWNAGLAAELIERHRVTESGGTGFFLRELIQLKDERDLDFSSLKLFTMGGTGVTPAEIRLADKNGIKAGRGYGSTEHSTVSIPAIDFTFEKRACTDGRVLRGNHVRIVDNDGREVAAGAQGEIVTQGPELFIGYQDPELNLENFFEGGWYRTGDIGYVDEDGFLVITDRKKDVIIRGGENVASKEVEDILNSMPEVLESVVVAMPDEHYGERVCAYVRLAWGKELSLEGVRGYFLQAGVARQKTPERLVLVDQLPRTPAGKVKKYQLRDELREAFESRQQKILRDKALGESG